VLAAEADVFVSSAEHNLFADLGDAANAVETRVVGRLLAAPADRFNFLNGVRPCEQARAAGKNSPRKSVFKP
jgi:hypothetical protein